MSMTSGRIGPTTDATGDPGQPATAAYREVASPGRHDWFVTGAAEMIGGPVGAHAARPTRSRFWTPVRIVLALTCIVFALHWVQKSPCRDGAWTNLKQYTHYCYTDVLALYYAEKLSDGAMPYRDHPVEYPVLTGAFMGAIGLPVHAIGSAVGPTFNQGQTFYDVNALVLGIFGLITVASILALRRRRPWDAAMMALAPALFFTATVNWDLFAVGLAALAMYAWARRHPVVAGIVLGLAVAAKFYPLLLLGPLLVLGLRSRRLVEATYVVGAAAASWFVVNAPVALLWPDSWLQFFRLNATRPIDWGTLWYIGVHLPTGRGRSGLPPFTWLGNDIPMLNRVYFLLFLLCCIGVVALALLAPRRPRLSALVFLTVALFVITGKVWSQQYVLWLIPLAVLARPKWGAFLAWQIGEVLYFLAFYGELMGASGKGVIPEWVFVLAALTRLVTLLVLCGYVVREALRPQLDPVRADGSDDPDGGYFDGAPDAPWVERLRAKLGSPARRVDAGMAV